MGVDLVESKSGVTYENMKFNYNLNAEYLVKNNGTTEFMIKDEDGENLQLGEV